jgi:tight adherence protein G
MLPMTLFNYKIVRQEKGGLAIVFAILLPFIISVCALVFDGSRVLMKRAKLSDALNEAALVVATSSLGKGTEEERKRNADLLKYYVSAYFPQDELKSSNVVMRSGIDGETGLAVPIYDLEAKLNVKTVLPLGSLAPSFDAQVGLTNGGSVRKGISDISLPADYVFVVDFSGSMTYFSDHLDKNGRQQKRIHLLKDVVDDLTKKTLEKERKTTFGIVPFDTGVPVLRAHPAPAEEFGCEVVMVPNADYNINYEFWGRMMPSLKSSNALEQRIYLHHHRYNVHENDIMRQMGYTSMASFSAATGICEPIDALELADPRYKNLNSNPKLPVPYVCDFISKGVRDPRGVEENLSLVASEYNMFAGVMLSYSLGGNSGYVFDNITVNVMETINGVFNTANLKSWSIPALRFKHDYIPPGSSSVISNSYFGPFHGTCSSARTRNTVDGSQLNYVIELTSDRDKLKPFIDDMWPSGGTTSTVGVLKGAQVLAKGLNPRKVMIVISDGEDNDKTLRDAFHKIPKSGKKLCDVIRDEMPNHSVNTEQVEIYFISVVGSTSDITRAKYWETHCTGEGNAFVANNYDDLMEKLTSIVSAYEETGYFNNR